MPGHGGGLAEQLRALTDPAAEAFSLGRIGPLVAGYRPPEAPFDAAGDWRHHYRLYSVAPRRLQQTGALVVRRTRLAPGRGVRLGLDGRRDAISGFSYYVRARLDSAADRLGTPASWEVETKLASSPDEPGYLGSGMLKRAEVGGGRLVLTTGGHRQEQRLEGPFTCKWALVDAVQRWPRDRPATFPFTLVDEFDQVRLGQLLVIRAPQPVALSGQTRPLTPIVHVGTGVLPAVYWTDAGGRLLFVVMGLEAYVLAEADGHAAHYPVNWNLS